MKMIKTAILTLALAVSSQAMAGYGTYRCDLRVSGGDIPTTYFRHAAVAYDMGDFYRVDIGETSVVSPPLHKDYPEANVERGTTENGVEFTRNQSPTTDTRYYVGIDQADRYYRLRNCKEIKK